MPKYIQVLILLFIPIFLSSPAWSKAPKECYDAQITKDVEEKIKLFTICAEDDELSEKAKIFAYSHRAVSLASIGKHQLAIEDFNTILNIDEEHLYTYINRGVSYNKLEQYELAVTDYNLASSLDDNSDPIVSSKIFSNRADAFFFLDNYQDAIADYSQAIQRNASNKSAFNNRGSCYSALNDHESALKDYDKALAIDPVYITALKNRGNTLAFLGNIKAAETDFNKIEELTKAKDTVPAPPTIETSDDTLEADENIEDALETDTQPSENTLEQEEVLQDEDQDFEEIEYNEYPEEVINE